MTREGLTILLAPSSLPPMSTPNESGPRTKGYVHGDTKTERDRLRRQARIVEHRVHAGLELQRVRRLLEVGCGVGGQSEVLLRRWPELHLLGIDANPVNLAAARETLDGLAWAAGRYELREGDAAMLEVEPGSCDGAFLCWVLEHVADPARVLSEVRRVLQPGSPVVCSEVQNASLFLSPYSPATLQYWSAFNDYQYDLGGDPFVGAKLGNLLQRVGYRDITTEVRTVLLDNRSPGERADFLEFWTDLLLSGAPGLLEAGRIEPTLVETMRAELRQVAHDPDAVFYYSFVQAKARVG